jgi:F-type H+/Na+-transporting ATPase subunit alpha
MRKVSGKIRLDLAQYRELVTFLQFGSELDKATQDQINRGERVVEVLKQGQYEPLSLSKQVMILYAVTNGFLDELPVVSLKKFLNAFLSFMDASYPGVGNGIETTGDMSQDATEVLRKAIVEFKGSANRK